MTHNGRCALEKVGQSDPPFFQKAWLEPIYEHVNRFYFRVLLDGLRKAFLGGSGGRAWPAFGNVNASLERRSSKSEYLYADVVGVALFQQDLSLRTSF